VKTDYTQIPLVFNVYKPVGPSSFSVVHHFKRNLSYNFGKIGHFGTLDPFAEGVLLVGVNGAQKLNEYVHELLPKTYRAIGIFGGKTDSGDFMTNVTAEKHIEENFQKMSQADLEEKLAKHFMGEYWQAPHSFSASKFEGKRLYQLAVQGKMIQKEKVKREILDFKLLNFNYPELEFVVTVSSGTYVRTLFEEIAEVLGGLGALRVLERVAIGSNTSDKAIKEGEWPKRGEAFDLEKWGTPLDQILCLNKVRLSSELTPKYLQGYRFPLEKIEIIPPENPLDLSSPDLFWVYNQDWHFLGLARPKDGEIQSIFNLKEAIALFI
jgi:tRNA pseudouridine55 synthase